MTTLSSSKEAFNLFLIELLKNNPTEFEKIIGERYLRLCAAFITQQQNISCKKCSIKTNIPERTIARYKKKQTPFLAKKNKYE